ncbi:MAG: HAD family hydrolase [Epsilonproteobacteria bacterium]|nr:HAD family hydrolase [Campylobacterota bacterium]
MVAIFDLDGTLVDSSNTLANAINYVRAKLNLPPLPKDEILYHINNPNTNLAKYFYEKENIEPIYEKWFKEYYSKNHNRELELFDGVDLMLKELKDSGVKLALATNGYRDSTLEALSYLNLKEHFDKIMTFEDVKNPKPAPDMLLKILKELNLPNSKAIFIGDSQRDYLASKEADIEFIGVDFINKKSSANDVKEAIKEYFKI